MFSNPLIAFGKTTYSRTGNLLGYDGGVPARLADKTRRYNAMQVTGTEADRTDWVIEQVLQDLDRKNLVVLRDPKGLATAEIIARVDKGYLKNTVWLDLDNPERLHPLCPFPTRQTAEAGLVAAWEAAFSESLGPLSAASVQTLKHLLQVLYVANGQEAYIRPCFSNLWQLIVVEDYRRFLLSRVPTAFWDLMPTEGALRALQNEIAPKLAEIFAVNRWRGMLTTPDAMGTFAWETALRSHPDKQVGFIAITGAKEPSDPVIRSALNFALWRKIAAWQRGCNGLPVFAFSLASDFFGTPALKPLLHGSTAAMSVTCAHNQPRDWLSYALRGQLSRTGKRIVVENGHGSAVSLKRLVTLQPPNYILSKIAKRYSAGKYARRSEHLLTDQQALFGNAEKLPMIYGALGQVPPHFMKAA